MGSRANNLCGLAGIQRGIWIAVLATTSIGLLYACALSRAAPASAAAKAVVAPCDQGGTRGADVVAGTRFNVSLPPFGMVCFLARRHLANPSEHETDLIGFELWRNGTRVYSLPMPPGYLWNELCDKVLAVGFSHRGEQTDIIVLGSCMTAGADELARPLIFSSHGDGFAVDPGLTVATLGLNTIEKVQRKIRAMRKDEHRASGFPAESSMRLRGTPALVRGGHEKGRFLPLQACRPFCCIADQVVGGCLSNNRRKALQYNGFVKQRAGVLPKVIRSRS